MNMKSNTLTQENIGEVARTYHLLQTPYESMHLIQIITNLRFNRSKSFA